jgi:hypothetical protein
MSSPEKPRNNAVLQEAVNMTNAQLAPKAVVREIGKVLQALFGFMARTPANRVILFSKIDLSDGFSRDPPGSQFRIVVPSALQMGWKESPPYFCAAMEMDKTSSNGSLIPRQSSHHTRLSTSYYPPITGEIQHCGCYPDNVSIHICTKKGKS